MENLKHDVLAKCNDDTDISENVVCRDSIEQERKARRIKLEEVRSTKRKGRSRTRRNRALLDSQRKDNRRALYIARWHNFLMDEGDVVADEVNAVLSQRLESSISTPELLNDEYSSLIARLMKYVQGDVFVDDIPDGVIDKVKSIKATALHDWKVLRSDTACVDKSSGRKTNALQDSSREVLIARRQSIRRFKKFSRMRRLQQRISRIKKILSGLSRAAKSDWDLRVLLK